MRCLVILNEPPGPRSRDLEKLLTEATHAEVCHYPTGICENRVCDPIALSGPYQIILHHCGVSNRDYAKFIRMYHQLCKARGWSLPLVICFSGDNMSVEGVHRSFPNVPLVGGVIQDMGKRFERNVPRLVQDWLERNKGCGSPPPDWNILKERKERDELKPDEERDSVWHRLANLVRRWVSENEPLEVEKTREELQQTLQEMSAYVLGDAKASGILTAMLDNLHTRREHSEQSAELEALLGKLAKTLHSDPPVHSPVSPVDYLSTEAPTKYNTILIADDDGSHPAFLSFLKQRGYAVSVERDVVESIATLESDPPAVFLCDLNFNGNSSAGLDLMSKAKRLAFPPFVVALSSSRLDLGQVPDADAKCDGVFAKNEQGAQTIHAMICAWAAENTA